MKTNKIVLKESEIRKLIQENIHTCINEAMDDKFSFEELSSLTSFAQRVKYCKEHLGFPIGNGSSRMVFQLDDEKCLKLAKNQKGIAQNGAEFDWGAQSYDVVPNIYDKADDDGWIVSEYVLPAKAKDIKVCLGIDFQTFCSFVRTAYSYYSYKGRMLWGKMSDEQFEDLLDKSEWLCNLYNYMADFQLPAGDFERLVNLGLTQRDGQPHLVILDTGLTQAIYDEFYR